MEKRKNYISWDEYFMGIAILSADRSKDPSTQVGCCVVSNDEPGKKNGNRILTVGYNGLPSGMDDDAIAWSREGEPLNTKYPYIVHSEINALMNNRSGSLEGSRMYVTLFPCNECAKAIIQAGIKQVIYLSDKYFDSDSVVAAKRMFDACGVACQAYVPSGRQINFTL